MQPRFKLSPATGTRLHEESAWCFTRILARLTDYCEISQAWTSIDCVPRSTADPARPGKLNERRVGRLAVHHVARSGAANGPYQVRSVIALTHGARPTVTAAAARPSVSSIPSEGRPDWTATTEASVMSRGLDGTMRRQSGEPVRRRRSGPREWPRAADHGRADEGGQCRQSAVTALISMCPGIRTDAALVDVNWTIFV